MQMMVNTPFTKIWKLRNEGSIAWPENTTLAFVGGDQLAKVESVVVPSPVSPLQEVDIAVDMFAPSKPGRYVSYWRLHQPDGTRFGQRVWVDISVSETKQNVTSMETDKQPEKVEQEEQVVVPPNLVESKEEFVLINNNNNSMEEAYQEPLEFSPELQQLLEMGFTSDIEFLRGILNANGNDVLKTVQQLLTMK